MAILQYQSPPFASLVNSETRFLGSHSNYMGKRMYSKWRMPLIGHLAKSGATTFHNAALSWVQCTYVGGAVQSKATKVTNHPPEAIIAYTPYSPNS